MFNDLASSWDDKFANSVTPLFLESIISKLEISNGQKILDVGTGTGILIPKLSKAVGAAGEVIAVDFAERMVEESRCKYANLSNVKIEVKNVEELDYPSESFDVVTCFGVFPHIQNKTKALTSIGNALKINGKLMIAHAMGRKELNIMHHRENSILAHDNLPSRTKMTRLLKVHGFDIEYFEDQPKIYLCISTKL